MLHEQSQMDRATNIDTREIASWPLAAIELWLPHPLWTYSQVLQAILEWSGYHTNFMYQTAALHNTRDFIGEKTVCSHAHEHIIVGSNLQRKQGRDEKNERIDNTDIFRNFEIKSTSAYTSETILTHKKDYRKALGIDTDPDDDIEDIYDKDSDIDDENTEDWPFCDLIPPKNPSSLRQEVISK